MSVTKKKNPNSLWVWFTPIVLGLVLTEIVKRVAMYVWSYELGALLYVSLYLLFFFSISTIIRTWFFKAEKTVDKPQPHPALDWPLPGPLIKFGNKIYLFTFIPSSFLSILNPFLFVQMMRQMFGQFKISKRLYENEDAFLNYKTKAQYRLPFDGEWLVYNGGNTAATSHSWDILTQRYAYDFVIADEQFSRHNNKGNRLHDYYCYEKPILAAADGEVISVVNNISPAHFVGYGVADFLCRNFAGNNIIIKHADGEYGFYAHLIKGTIDLKPGDKVSVGDRLGLCGFTGHSTEPHLHFHLQDRPNLYLGMGLPIQFYNVKVDDDEDNEQEGYNSSIFVNRGSKVKHIKH